MGTKQLRKRVRRLERRIREHEVKLRAEAAGPNPREGVMRHWEAEIRAFRGAFRGAADRARKRLGRTR